MIGRLELTFVYTADERIDFRDCVRDLARRYGGSGDGIEGPTTHYSDEIQSPHSTDVSILTFLSIPSRRVNYDVWCAESNCEFRTLERSMVNHRPIPVSLASI